MKLSISPDLIENDIEEALKYGQDAHTIIPQRNLIIQFLGNEYTIQLKVNQRVTWKEIGKTILKEYKKLHLFDKEKLKLVNNVHVSSVLDLKNGVELNINEDVQYRPSYLLNGASGSHTNSSSTNRYKLLLQSNLMLFSDDAIIQILLKFLIIPPSTYYNVNVDPKITKSLIIKQSVDLVKSMNSLIRVNRRFHRIFTSDLIWNSIVYPGDIVQPGTLPPLFNYTTYNKLMFSIANNNNSEEEYGNEVDLLDYSLNSPNSKELDSNIKYNKLLDLDEISNITILGSNCSKQEDQLFQKSLNINLKNQQCTTITSQSSSQVSPGDNEIINLDSKFSSWYGSGYMGSEKDMWEKIRDDSGLPVISVYRLRYMAHNTSRVRLFYGSLRPPELKSNQYIDSNVSWFKKIIPKFSSILSPSLSCMSGNDNFESNNANSLSSSPTLFRINNFQYSSLPSNNNQKNFQNELSINKMNYGGKEGEITMIEDQFSINRGSNKLNPYYMTFSQSTSPCNPHSSNSLPSSPFSSSYFSSSSINLISNTIILVGLNRQNISSKFISLLHYLLPISVLNFHYHPLCKPLLPGGILKEIKKSPRNSHSSKLEKDPGTRVETDALGEIIYQRLGDNRLTFLQFFYTPLLRSIIKNGNEGMTKILLSGKKDVNDAGINMLYEDKKYFYTSPYNTFYSLNPSNQNGFNGGSTSSGIGNSINSGSNYNISSLSKSFSNNSLSNCSTNSLNNNISGIYTSYSLPTSPNNSNPSSPVNYVTTSSPPSSTFIPSPSSNNPNLSPINYNYSKANSTSIVSEYNLKNNPWILLTHQALGYIFFFEYSYKEKEQMVVAIKDMIQLIISNYKIRNKPILIYVGIYLTKDSEGKEVVETYSNQTNSTINSSNTTSSSIDEPQLLTVQSIVEFVCGIIKQNTFSDLPLIRDCPWYVQPIDLNSIESCFQYSYSYDYSTKPAANMKKGYYAGLNWLIRSLLQGKEC